MEILAFIVLVLLVRGRRRRSTAPSGSPASEPPRSKLPGPLDPSATADRFRRPETLLDVRGTSGPSPAKQGVGPGRRQVP